MVWLPGGAFIQIDGRSSSAVYITKIFVRTRKVGISQVSCSIASGSARQMVRSRASAAGGAAPAGAVEDLARGRSGRAGIFRRSRGSCPCRASGPRAIALPSVRPRRLVLLELGAPELVAVHLVG